MIVLLVPIVILLWLGIRIVPQGQEWVVERLGQFHAVIKPGFNLIFPIFDKVSYKVTTKDIILDVAQQEVLTSDNAVILANAVAFLSVPKIHRYVYDIDNLHEGIRNMGQTSVR